MVSVLELRLLQFKMHVRVFVLLQLLPYVSQDDQEPQGKNTGGPKSVYKLSRRPFQPPVSNRSTYQIKNILTDRVIACFCVRGICREEIYSTAQITSSCPCSSSIPA